MDWQINEDKTVTLTVSISEHEVLGASVIGCLILAPSRSGDLKERTHVMQALVDSGRAYDKRFGPPNE